MLNSWQHLVYNFAKSSYLNDTYSIYSLYDINKKQHRTYFIRFCSAFNFKFTLNLLTFDKVSYVIRKWLLFLTRLLASEFVKVYFILVFDRNNRVPSEHNRNFEHFVLLIFNQLGSSLKNVCRLKDVINETTRDGLIVKSVAFVLWDGFLSVRQINFNKNELVVFRKK